jgi:hypothetical protein
LALVLQGVVNINGPNRLADVVRHRMEPIIKLVLFDPVGDLPQRICGPFIERRRIGTRKVQFDVALKPRCEIHFVHPVLLSCFARSI